MSAHRTPDLLFEYAGTAEARGLQVIIAGAGGAAHLPGMAAAKTALPVLGVPVESAVLRGVDSLLSIVQMPAGVPVGTLAIGKAGAINAAILAATILGNKDAEVPAGGPRVPGEADGGGSDPPGPAGGIAPSGPVTAHAYWHPRRRTARSHAGPGRAPPGAQFPRPRAGRRVPGRGRRLPPPRRLRGLPGPVLLLPGARRRHLRVRKRPGRVGPLAGRARPRLPHTGRPGGRPGPPRREDVLPEARGTGPAVRGRRFAGGPGRRRRPHRPAGRPQDDPVRLRRQGPGGPPQRGRCGDRLDDARRPAAGARRVRPVRPRVVDPGRPRPVRANWPSTPWSRTSTGPASCG